MKFTSYQENSSPWINLVSHFSFQEPYSEQMIWISNWVQLLSYFDHPLVKTRLETQVGAFSYIPHPKAPAAAGSHGDPAPCLSVSSLVLFHLNTPVSMWHSPPFIRRWGNYGLEGSRKLPRVPRQVSAEICSVWVHAPCTSTTLNCCCQPESWKPAQRVYFFPTRAATGWCDLRSSYS